MKNIIKNVLLVLVYIFLLFKLASIGMIMVYILLSVTGNLLVSYAIPCIATALIATVPVIVKAAKSKKMKTGMKCIIIGLVIVLLSVGAFFIMQA